jgi:hypothetical protein
MKTQSRPEACYYPTAAKIDPTEALAGLPFLRGPQCRDAPQALNITSNAGTASTNSRLVAATVVGRDAPVPTLTRRIGFTSSLGNGPKTIHARFQNVAVSELFLNWIRQHLRIKASYGASGNAVKTRVRIAVRVCALVAVVGKRLRLEASLCQVLQDLTLPVGRPRKLQHNRLDHGPGEEPTGKLTGLLPVAPTTTTRLWLPPRNPSGSCTLTW